MQINDGYVVAMADKWRIRLRHLGQNRDIIGTLLGHYWDILKNYLPIIFFILLTNSPSSIFLIKVNFKSFFNSIK